MIEGLSDFDGQINNKHAGLMRFEDASGQYGIAQPSIG
jgi:hypothetical protein